MSADEYLRPAQAQLRLDAPLVAAGISSDVSHRHAHLLAVEKLPARISQTHRSPVDIAANATQRLEGRDRVGRFDSSEVAGMPQLVDIGEKVAQRRVERTVGIRKYSDSFQSRPPFRILR